MGADRDPAKGIDGGADGPETPAAPPAEDAAASAFGAVLEALSRAISPLLIDETGWARLRAAVGELPVGPGAGFGFELRLDEAAAGTDFYVTLTRGSVLANHHVRLGERASPGSAAAMLGDRLAALDADAPWCELLGLEYDVASGAPGARPGLFARVRSDATQAGVCGSPAAETVAEWLTGAVGWRLAGDEGRTLGRTFDAMAAAGGTVDCLGIMPDRPGRMFKVLCRPMESGRAMQVLERLGWAGPAGRVEAFLSRFEKSFRSLRLAVGVTAQGIAPRIGFELSRGEASSFSRPGTGGWAPLLTRLREEGLCRAEKMDGLLAWPGRELVFRGPDTFGVLTGIGHVKVSFDAREAGAAVEAKAYPGAGLASLRDGALAIRGPMSHRRQGHDICRCRMPGRGSTRREWRPRASKTHCRR